MNVIGLTGFGVLGFGHPGFWLLGAGLEAAYLYALSTNKRFQRLVDATDQHVEQRSVADERQALVAKLIPPSQEHLRRLESRCERILQLHRDAQADDFIVEGNRDALQKLTWLHLKLLIARQNLLTTDSKATEAAIRSQISTIENDLRSQRISPSLKESKEATLLILQRRAENLERREQTLLEIESDLTRIEAQIELAADQAEMRGKPETISANIDLVSHLLDDTVFGDSGASVAALERTYGGTQ